MKICYKGDIWFFTHHVALTGANLKWHLPTFAIPLAHVAFTILVHWGRGLRQTKLAGTLQSLGSPAAPRHGVSGAVGDDYAMGTWEHTISLPLPSASSPLWHSYSWGEQTGFGALGSQHKPHTCYTCCCDCRVSGRGKVHIHKWCLVIVGWHRMLRKLIPHSFPFTVLHWI